MNINKNATLLMSVLFFMMAVSAQIPEGYYDSAIGSGYALKTQLHYIIDGHTAVSYTPGVWNAFSLIEVDNYFENDGSPLDVYSENPAGADPYGWTFVADQCGNYSGEGGCYNREHSFPQSWFNDASPMVTDLFHIYLTDGYVNSKRSNYPFGEVTAATWTSQNGSKLGPCSYPGYTGTVFEPIDEFKGDFARSYFYMATRYEDVISGWPGSDMLDGSSDKVFTDWALNMLIDWHGSDPVSQKEIDRNNLIYSDVQHNRNPFIDHPEYVNYIWGGTPPVPSVNFVTSSQTVEEDSGPNTVTLSISQSIPDDVTANLTLTGTAVSGSDYTISSNSVFFPASLSDNRSVTLTITDDPTPEDFETIIITINSLTTANPEIVIGNNDQITFTINNNDGFDETPPTIFTHQILNDSTLVLSFSEELDPVTSQTLTNYVLNNGGGNPLDAVLGYSGDSSKVVLSFTVFAPGTSYELTINNVEDLAGNPIAANTTVNFSISSGSGEGWVERFEDNTWTSYTTGAFTYPTGDWDFVSVYQEPASASYEGEHAVRINDDTANASITSPSINGVDSVIFYFRTLNNEASPSTFWLQKSVGGGAYSNVQSQSYQFATYNKFAYKVNDASDNIRLRILNNSQSGHLIIDYFRVVTLSGPPEDTTPPEILSHMILNDSTLVVTFSEELDPATSQSAANYLLDNGAGNPDTAVPGYAGDYSKVALYFSPFQEDVNYQLTIYNVEDLAGNPIAANSTLNFTIISGSGEGWVERFEDGPTWTSYATGTKTYGTGDWDINSIYLETSAAYAYEGSHALRLNDDTANSYLTAPSVNGVDSVIFQYRTLNQEGSVSTFWLQKSVDGSAYTNIVSQTFQNNTYSEFAYKVNDPSNNIRLRILNNDQTGHLIIDYFKVVQFPAAEPPSAPANVTTQISGTDLVIGWDPVSGAASYDIYSSNDPYNNFGYEATVSIEQYTVECTEAKKFYYIVASTTAKALKPGESHERFIEIK